MPCTHRNGRQPGRAVPNTVTLACSCGRISGKQEQGITHLTYMCQGNKTLCPGLAMWQAGAGHSCALHSQWWSPPDPNAVRTPCIQQPDTDRQTGRPLRSPWWQAVRQCCA